MPAIPGTAQPDLAGYHGHLGKSPYPRRTRGRAFRPVRHTACLWKRQRRGRRGQRQGRHLVAFPHRCGMPVPPHAARHPRPQGQRHGRHAAAVASDAGHAAGTRACRARPLRSRPPDRPASARYAGNTPLALLAGVPRGRHRRQASRRADPQPAPAGQPARPSRPARHPQPRTARGLHLPPAHRRGR